MTAALIDRGPVTLAEIDRFVDGAAVRRIGDLPYAVAAGLGARPVARATPIAGGFDVVHVDEGAICTAILELYQNEGIIAEPAGALSVAALPNIAVPAGARVVCLVDKSTDYSPDSRKFFETMRGDYKRMASVVHSPVLRASINFMLRVMGHVNDFRMFSSEAEAMTWLDAI